MAANTLPRIGSRMPAWTKVLVVGLAAWATITVVAVGTDVVTLIPSVILVGSFLTPVVFLIWAVQRQTKLAVVREGYPSALTIDRIAAAFGASGMLGVAAAATLETLLLANHPIVFYPGVALIEELIKLALLALFAMGLDHYSRRDGMVLGAAVGFGFAAFESAGYAFNAFISNPSTPLLSLLQTEATRALLTPVGHGLWTALVGGALFAAAARCGHLALSWGVVLWLVIVVALHATWDLAAPLAAILTQVLTGERVTVIAFETGRLASPTPAQARLDAGLDWALLTTCMLVGLALARLQWHSLASARHTR